MKKFLCLFFIITSAGYAQERTTPIPTQAAATPSVSANAPIISFEQPEYWFGRMKKGSSVTHKFYYKNTGLSPLVIYQCKAGCVCTTAKCAKDSVRPGETGFIEVHYDSTHVGTFAKDFFIKSNAKNGTVDLIIRGVIEDTDNGTDEKTPAINEEKVKPQ